MNLQDHRSFFCVNNKVLWNSLQSLIEAEFLYFIQKCLVLTKHFISVLI